MNTTNPTLMSKIQSASRSIGAILVDAGKLTAPDADRILKIQREQGLKFGEAAIQLGLLTENDILYALSVQFNHPYLSGASPRQALSDDLVAAYRPFSKEGEHVRTLRSQLQMRLFDENHKHKALAVVSPGRGEGRSYLAANLAIAFAQSGERTLLIDGNMREPAQHKLFNLDNDNGLSKLLAGRIDDRVVNFVGGLPGLGVLTSGPTPPNPTELLGRHAFEAILTKSAMSFDVVIIDTPAVDSGMDAELLARFAGAALVIARSNLTPMAEFNGMVERMRQNGTQVVGSVLVDVPVKRSSPKGQARFEA
jgi:protein-tyrosine kinase